MDVFSPSDAYAIVYEKNTTNVDQTLHPTHPTDHQWVRVGHTEVIMDLASPNWESAIQIELNNIGMLSGEFKVDVYDADEPDLMDLSAQDIIGSALFSWEIFGPDGVGTANLGLVDKNGKVVQSKGNPSSTLQITSKVYSNKPRRACVTLDSSCKDHDADTVVQFVQITQGESNVQHYTQPSLIKEREIIVYQTPVSVTNYPPFALNEDILYNTPASNTKDDDLDGIPFVSENAAFTIVSEEVENENKPSGEFEVRLVRFKDTMNTKILGKTRIPASHTSLCTTNNNTHSFHSLKLTNPDPKKAKESSIVNIRNWRTSAKCPSFRDFENSGLNYKLSFAIDCSGSKQKNAGGLHDLNAEGQNVYTWAIRDIGELLTSGLGADRISEIRSFAFGGPANDPNAVNPHERYALSTKSTQCHQISDVVDQYVTFTKIPFTRSNQPATTNFAPFLRFFNDSKVVVKENIQQVGNDGMKMTDPTYNILVILTDGEVSDKNETNQALYELSLKPVTVIFVGIGADGNTKFKDLAVYDTAVNGKGVLRVEKQLHLARHSTVLFPYLYYVKSLHYLKIKMVRTIAKQLVEQFFLANKFPVFKTRQ